MLTLFAEAPWHCWQHLLPHLNSISSQSCALACISAHASPSICLRHSNRVPALAGSPAPSSPGGGPLSLPARPPARRPLPWQVELLCRVAALLVRLHMSQMMATPSARPLLIQLQTLLRQRVQVGPRRCCLTPPTALAGARWALFHLPPPRGTAPVATFWCIEALVC